MLPFVILGMPRTGSTLLLTGLSQHPDILVYGELFHCVHAERSGAHAIIRGNQRIYFDEKVDDAIQYLKKNVFAQSNEKKAVGFKLFAEFVNCKGTDRLFTRLKEEFPDIRIIHIVRENYLDVLVSKNVAEATKQWVCYAGQEGKKADPVRITIDYKSARKFFENMLLIDRFFQNFFGGPNYLKVDYGKLASDYTSVMNEVYQFLDVTPFIPEKKIIKQISLRARDIVRNFGSLRKSFIDTEFERFFVTGYAEMLFLSDSVMKIGEYTFDLDWSENTKTKFSKDKHFILMKSKRVIQQYQRLFDDLIPSNLFELGIKHGGSMAMFNLAYRPQTHVAIDIGKNPISALQSVIDLANSEGRKMLPLFGVDQGDRKKLVSIVKNEFRMDNPRPLDLVIDDASHRFDLSVASFETLFPFVRNDGYYAIEDWGWAHWVGFQGPNAYLSDQPALTNMIFQLIILHTCRPDIISEILITPVVVFVKRGPVDLNPETFRIADHLVMRGRQLTYI